MRYNAFLEKYITCRQIEFDSLIHLVNQHVMPSAIEYKNQLVQTMHLSSEAGVGADVEKEICAKLTELMKEVSSSTLIMQNNLSSFSHDEQKGCPRNCG